MSFPGKSRHRASCGGLTPLAALVILAIFNLIAETLSLLNNGSKLAILTIGKTLMTAASGGQDISVGATIAIAGSVILRVLCGTDSRSDTL